MTELEKQLYEALRALDEHVTVLGRYAGKDTLERQCRRALQGYRARRREEEKADAPRLHPDIRTAPTGMWKGSEDT